MLGVATNSLYFIVGNGNWKWYNQMVNYDIEKIRYVNLFNRR